MKRAVLITLAVLTIGLTSCSKDTCLEDKQAEREKYERLLQEAINDPAEYEIILRNMNLRLAQFDC